jgi:hypothetical protein
MTGIGIQAVNAPRRVDGAGAPAAAVGLASWLHLAATPTFAIMAVLTALYESPMDTLCAAGPGPLSGMVAMYLLMSAFHASPWLNLMFGRRSAVGRS